MTAPACSAAFPTIGNRMMLMKLTDIPHDADASCYKLLLLKFLNKEKLFMFFGFLNMLDTCLIISLLILNTNPINQILIE